MYLETRSVENKPRSDSTSRAKRMIVRRLETPPQSPDLNLIENLWMHLDTEVRGKNITSKENLKFGTPLTQKSQRN
ncbi:hypothetical protein TNCV_4264291 [Trichonephila clavipes]|nr:hypothetical protein TNCV_4264291 [Trichonephila clavipes]